MYKIYVNPLPSLVLYGKKMRFSGWQHDEVIKEHHCLFLNLDGECTFIVDEKEKKVNKNSALLIPRGTKYASRIVEDCLHLFFYFDAELTQIDQSERYLLDEDAFLLPSTLSFDATTLYYLESIPECSEKDAYDNLSCRTVFLMALIRMARLEAEGIQHPIAMRIKRYLCENIAEDVSLDVLEKHFGYSKQYLIRVFKADTGQSPMAHLADMRLEKSKIALLDESKSISQVASACGFVDANYFSRVFRRRYALSPGAYRKKASFP